MDEFGNLLTWGIGPIPDADFLGSGTSGLRLNTNTRNDPGFLMVVGTCGQVTMTWRKLTGFDTASNSGSSETSFGPNTEPEQRPQDVHDRAPDRQRRRLERNSGLVNRKYGLAGQRRDHAQHETVGATTMHKHARRTGALTLATLVILLTVGAIDGPASVSASATNIMTVHANGDFATGFFRDTTAPFVTPTLGLVDIHQSNSNGSGPSTVFFDYLLENDSGRVLAEGQGNIPNTDLQGSAHTALNLNTNTCTNPNFVIFVGSCGQISLSWTKVTELLSFSSAGTFSNTFGGVTTTESGNSSETAALVTGNVLGTIAGGPTGTEAGVVMGTMTNVILVISRQ